MYLTKLKLADQLHISLCETVTMSICAFGGTSTPSTLQPTNIQLITRAGDEVPLSVLVGLTIQSSVSSS